MIEQFYREPFPVLDIDDELILREHVMEDTPAFFEYYKHPEVSKFVLSKIPETEFEAESEIYYCKSMFKQLRGIYWTIAYKHDNKMIGAIGLYSNNFHHRAEVSYDMSPDHFGKGVMTRALTAVTRFAIEKAKFERIEAVTMTDNVRSMGLLKKCGYTHEGTMRQYKRYDGENYDVEMFSFVRSDLKL